MQEKKKMDEKTKIKLIYSGEYILIAVLFLVLGILKITGIMGTNDTFHTIFKWVTIFGGTWLVIDFFWTLFSPIRRRKSSLLDKSLNLPIGIYLITFDIMAFAGMDEKIGESYWLVGVGILFIYIAINYAFQGIYHWFHPLESILEMAEDENKDSNQ